MRRHALAVVISSVFAVTVSAAPAPAVVIIPASPPVPPLAAGFVAASQSTSVGEPSSHLDRSAVRRRGQARGLPVTGPLHGGQVEPHRPAAVPSLAGVPGRSRTAGGACLPAYSDSAAVVPTTTAPASSSVPLVAPAVVAARQAAGQPAPSPAPLESENLFWQSIVNSTNPEDFEAYLEAFPDGLFRRLAQNRLDMLAAAPNPDASAGTGSPFSSITTRYVAAMDNRAPNELLATIHSQSPLFTMTIQQIQQVFPLYDIEVLHQNLRDLGSDGLDHIATVTLFCRKRSGPVFQNNATKAAIVFRQENEIWKIWSILTIEQTLLP